MKAISEFVRDYFVHMRVAITCDDWKTTCYDKILLIEIPE